MAEIIAEKWKLSGQIVAAASSSVNRGLKSPADISMDISRLKADLNPHLTPFAAAIDQIGSMSEPLVHATCTQHRKTGPVAWPETSPG